MLASLLVVLAKGTKNSLSAYPDAVCVDGTPGAYYYEPATTATGYEASASISAATLEP